MGIVNQLTKLLQTSLSPYDKSLAQIQHGCRVPTKIERSEIKAELARPTVLALYDPQAPTMVCANASSYGLGAVLMQKSDSWWRPIAYVSCSLSETERRYVQIGKEVLANTWACKKFSTYILGMKFLTETDHKPLVPVLRMTHLYNLPPRVLKFRRRLERFDYNIVKVPGKLAMSLMLCQDPPPHRNQMTPEFRRKRK